ncbi:MAG: hypothetical protein LKJ86_09520 [Oscillibacter sp.]|jgi:hypothetical protein|nr:hypothetical protein [Oscillibacter sp.]
MEKTFTLTIDGTECGEWQGSVKDADGSRQDFASLLELIRYLNQKLGKEVTG